MKPSLVRVLKSLGFKCDNDMSTIIPLDAFDKLEDSLVIEIIDEYKLGLSGIYIPMDGERKLELVNRVLELKHGMIIDQIKEIDAKDKEGYQLENIML